MTTDRTNAINACKKLRLQRIEKYNLNPKRCKTCNKPIPYEEDKRKIFCSHKCSAIFNNKDCVRHGLKHKRCKDCNNKIYPRNNKTERCRKCETIHKILNGTYRGKNAIRNYLIKIRGYICEECKNIEWRGKSIPLDLHHIDGNKNNNNLKNLKLLCKNCHGLTETYGYKNSKKLNATIV